MRKRALALTLALASVELQAATYRWTDEGVPVYADRPLEAGMKPLTGTPPAPTAAERTDDARQSLANRQAALRYPVVLYTTPECAPCATARAHLVKRGLPYNERTVSTSADLAAFRRLGFTEGSMPALSVGRERLAGFDAAAWDRLFDAAGYGPGDPSIAGKPGPVAPLVAVDPTPGSLEENRNAPGPAFTPPSGGSSVLGGPSTGRAGLIRF